MVMMRRGGPVFVRRGPGLLGTMLIAGGTAAAVSGRSNAKQQAAANAQQQQEQTQEQLQAQQAQINQLQAQQVQPGQPQQYPPPYQPGAAPASPVAGQYQQQYPYQPEAPQYQAQVAAPLAPAPGKPAAVPTPGVPAAVSAPGTGNDLVAQLQQLASLRDSGVLSATEFEAAKTKLLGS